MTGAVGQLESASRIGPEPRITANSHTSERWILLGIFAASFAYLCLFRRHASMEPDEGIVLEGAQRVSRGEVPYRDFFSFYTPGSYYLQALCFKLFGDSLPAARVVLAACGAAFSAVTYALARRACTRRVAVTVALLVTLTTVPFRFLVLHNWYSTLWACLALYCSVRFLEFPSRSWAFMVGTLASVTVLFEQSKGAGLSLGLAIAFAAIHWTGPRPWFKARQWGTLALGFVWPIVLTLGYFASQHVLTAMLADWFWPLKHYSQSNRVPYGYQNWSDATRQELFATGSLAVRAIKMLAISPCLWLPVLPLIGLGVLVYCFWRGRRTIPVARRNYYLVISGVSTGLLLSVVIVRADIIHFMYLQPIFAIVLAWAMDRATIHSGIFPRIRPLLNAYTVIALFLLGMVPLAGVAAFNDSLVTRRGVLTTSAKDTVIDYVQRHVQPGDKVLVYPYLPLYNYLTDTSSPGRYDYFQPGMNTPEQAAEMISELQTSRDSTVLFEMSFPEKIPRSWPGTSMTAIASDPVADYIVHHYKTCAILQSPSQWTFLFMVRKDLSCP